MGLKTNSVTPRFGLWIGCPRLFSRSRMTRPTDLLRGQQEIWRKDENIDPCREKAPSSVLAPVVAMPFAPFVASSTPQVLVR